MPGSLSVVACTLPMGDGSRPLSGLIRCRNTCTVIAVRRSHFEDVWVMPRVCHIAVLVSDGICGAMNLSMPSPPSILGCSHVDGRGNGPVARREFGSPASDDSRPASDATPTLAPADFHTSVQRDVHGPSGGL
ncbi:hypothetical protein KC335_g132 [Hortaea werneckii]|nr:hypothetical protein KC335_g132 [Hortaea werneckii]